MASFTSESDSTTFAGEEMQRYLLYYFVSLTTDMNPDSQNLRVPAAGRGNEGCVSIIFCFWLYINPFRLQSMATLKKGDECQMWEFIRILFTGSRIS
jgi:hypothetical protein